MRYLDTGTRDPAHTLAMWLEESVAEPIKHLRFQTGFYALDGLHPLLGVLDHLKTHSLPISALIGSNEGTTLRNDVEELAFRMGIPRKHALLGVVRFGGKAYFHPKVYHFERADGTQLAFVGSANLTASGLALHAEAGIALDSRHDDLAVLTQIASTIDQAFHSQQTGLTVVDDIKVLDQLVAEGDLALTPPPRPSPAPSKAGSKGAIVQLKPIVQLNRVPRLVTLAPPVAPLPDAGDVPAGASSAAIAAQPSPTQAFGVRPVAVRQGFPEYLWFKPSATTSTSGKDALTGNVLPNGATGLIVKLNRDSARHFSGGVGTSNMSLPVGTALTLRFGIAGVHKGPTATFDLHMRYIGDALDLRANVTSTSVKGYGYTANETGHGDIRMVVTAEARRLKDKIEASAMAVPSINNFALLEWPTESSPSFKLTFLDPLSVVHQTASALYVAADAANELVGNACWLPIGLSPAW